MIYDHSFALGVTKVIVVISLGIYLINVALSFIVYYLLKLKKENKVGYINITDQIFDVKIQEKSTSVIIVESINIVLFWFIIMLLALALVVYQAFNLIHPWLCGWLILLLGQLGMFIQIWRSSQFWKNKQFKKRYINAALYFKYVLILELIIVLFFSIFLLLAFQKGCLCVYNKAYGIEIFLDLKLSTKWTRANLLPERICLKGTLCHLYITLSDETSKEVFINVHAGSDIKELNAEVKFKDDKINQKCDKIPFLSSVERITKCVHMFFNRTLILYPL